MEQDSVFDEEQPTILTIKGLNRRGTILNFHWGVGNELAVFTTINKEKRHVEDLVRLLEEYGRELQKKGTSPNHTVSLSNKIIKDSTTLIQQVRGNKSLSSIESLTNTLKRSAERLLSHLNGTQVVKSEPYETLLEECEATALTLGSKGRAVFSNNKNNMQTGAEEQQLVWNIRWNTYLGETRKLLCEAESYFLMTQRRAQEHRLSTQASSSKSAEEFLGAQYTEDLLQLSKHYRAIITAHVMSLQETVSRKKINTTPFPELDYEGVVQEYNKAVEMYQIAGVIWHFAEIFLISTKEAFLGQLIEWINLYFGGHENLQMLGEVLEYEQPEEHPEYWNLLFRLLFRGQISSARELLRQHSRYNVRLTEEDEMDLKDENDLFAMVDILLRTMPHNMEGRPGVNDNLMINFKQWQEDCNSVLDSRNGMDEEESLLIILRILVGDEDTLVERTETWYELLISKILFQEPSIKKIEARYLAQQCLQYYPQLTPLDEILMAIIEDDADKAILECPKYFDNSWLVAHLADILYHANKMNPYTLQDVTRGTEVNLREHFLLEYATELMTMRSMWQVCSGYLVNCSTFGKFYMEEMMDHLPTETDMKATKALDICNQYQLESQWNTIHKVMGMRKLQEGQHGACIYWLMKARQIERVSQVANKILELYMESGNFEEIDEIIESLGTDLSFSSKLIFLEKYREMSRLLKGGDEGQYGKFCLQLMVHRIAPKRFWLPLLLRLAPLLSRPVPVFDSEETFQLMHCLEEISLSHRRDELMPSSQQQSIHLLGLALTTNLSRVLVED